MDLMKKAKKAAAVITRSDNDGKGTSELNLYTREVHKNGAVLLDSAASELARQTAIKMLGFVGYLASPDVTRVLATYMQPMLHVLKDERSPRMQLAVVRSLSALCHRNRVTQDIVLGDRDAVNTLIKMMNNTADVRPGRWAAYAFVVMLSDNVAYMRRLSEMSELRCCLEVVAGVDVPWAAWGMNYAELALAMLGFWPSTKSLIDSLDLPIHFYKDASDDEAGDNSSNN